LGGAAAVPAGDGAPLDPSQEEELWVGRPSWRHYYPLWILWTLGALVFAIFGIWLRHNVSWLSGRWSAYTIALIILLSGLYVLIRVVLKVYGLRYRLTTQRLFIERGLIARSIDQTELIRVDDVRVRQGVFDRIFGVGTVEVMSTDVSDAQASIVGVENPQQIAEHIRQHMRILRRKSLFIERL